MNSIYFVVTTITTCGYGDIYATPGDHIEALAVYLSELAGMFFYALTMEKLKAYFISDEQPSDLASHMMDMLEILIVKVGLQTQSNQDKTEEMAGENRLTAE